eukprot:CAMPEP_0204252482 /NCGR_PEP_ID=MMETSP0468-20130131/1212_1 /ASSEMBLY_ACC=CAM_ASM_000383 /TAXON_ID=2969 /ORGANISM="Oxyrrhis marina" /LENGTH=129 /DNA_ID=CAMNT_0051225921 /DNA_START=574 /DNA_END=959 /DNA_ORIENTATION=+
MNAILAHEDKHASRCAISDARTVQQKTSQPISKAKLNHCKIHRERRTPGHGEGALASGYLYGCRPVSVALTYGHHPRSAEKPPLGGAASTAGHSSQLLAPPVRAQASARLCVPGSEIQPLWSSWVSSTA